VALGSLCQDSLPERGLEASSHIESEAFDDPKERAGAHLMRAQTFFNSAKFEEARSALNDVRLLVEELAVPALLADFDLIASALAMTDGRLSEAKTHNRSAAERYRTVNADGRFTALSNLAYDYWVGDELAEAAKTYADVVDQLRATQFPDAFQVAWVTANLAGVLIENDDLERGLRAGREAMPVLIEVGSAWLFLDHFALRAGLAGKHQVAGQLSGYVEATYKKRGARLDPAEMRVRERLRALLRERASSEWQGWIAEGVVLPEEQALRLAIEP
jgi:hypothetical protein